MRAVDPAVSARSLSLPLVLLSLTPPARATDHVEGTRSEKVHERSHEVRAALHRGFVELRVRRRVENLGARHDQAMFWIATPEGAVATGLRTLGSVAGRPQWFAGDLMEAEAAAEKYKELTGIGGYYPKDPALLSWRWQGQLLLQVFPVPPNDSKTIEYTLLAPTHYRDGAHRYSLERLGTGDLAAEVTLAAPARGERLLVGGKKASPGTKLTTPVDETTELGLVPKTSEPLGGELAVAATGARFVTHFSIEAAPKVASVPRGADIVVVIDRSRSMSAEMLDAQKAALAAYLAHFADASVEVLTFDRKTQARYGKLVPVERARRELTTLAIEQKNGSAVDHALDEAEKVLAARPAGRARRIVLMSDALVRSRLRPERIRAAVGASGAVVHVGVYRGEGVRLERDDEHAWASAIRTTGGLVWRAGSSDEKSARKQLKQVYEEWARPLRVDHVRLYSADLEVGALSERPEVLDEGQGHEQLLFTPRRVGWLRVEGELWSKPVARVIHADRAAGKRWAALVFGSELANQLSEPEMMKLAIHGGAVSPVTSYLAIEPGVRPSTEGLDWGASGTGSGFGNGTVSLRMGATSVSGQVRPLDREKWLQDALGPSFASCGGKPGSASISLETTFAELVDVVKVDLGGLSDPMLERCISEAAWDLVLPVQFDAEWATWKISL